MYFRVYLVTNLELDWKSIKKKTDQNYFLVTLPSIADTIHDLKRTILAACRLSDSQQAESKLRVFAAGLELTEDDRSVLDYRLKLNAPLQAYLIHNRAEGGGRPEGVRRGVYYQVGEWVETSHPLLPSRSAAGWFTARVEQIRESELAESQFDCLVSLEGYPPGRYSKFWIPETDLLPTEPCLEPIRHPYQLVPDSDYLIFTTIPPGSQSAPGWHRLTLNSVFPDRCSGPAASGVKTRNQSSSLALNCSVHQPQSSSQSKTEIQIKLNSNQLTSQEICFPLNKTQLVKIEERSEELNQLLSAGPAKQSKTQASGRHFEPFMTLRFLDFDQLQFRFVD